MSQSPRSQTIARRWVEELVPPESFAYMLKGEWGNRGAFLWDNKMPPDVSARFETIKERMQTLEALIARDESDTQPPHASWTNARQQYETWYGMRHGASRCDLLIKWLKPFCDEKLRKKRFDLEMVAPGYKLMMKDPAAYERMTRPVPDELKRRVKEMGFRDPPEPMPPSEQVRKEYEKAKGSYDRLTALSSGLKTLDQSLRSLAGGDDGAANPQAIQQGYKALRRLKELIDRDVRNPRVSKLMRSGPEMIEEMLVEGDFIDSEDKAVDTGEKLQSTELRRMYLRSDAKDASELLGAMLKDLEVIMSEHNIAVPTSPKYRTR